MSNLISENYASQLKQMHNNLETFGAGGMTAKHYPLIKNLVLKNNVRSILDYGCGKGHFIEYAQANFPGVRVEGFDVASEKYAKLPDGKFDMVVCLDVMEHVEFGALSNVLSEIRQRDGKLFFCSVANYPAQKKLSDGRNAHVTQLPFGYWFTLFSGFFKVQKFSITGEDDQEAIFICSKLRQVGDWR
jgi:2-polyprenyl-3-methyl-5-hydroxy-6-metoxy-1,4-benzoquinol methylase